MLRKYGKQNGERREISARHQSPILGGENHQDPHLRLQVLEGGMLRPHRRIARGQGDGVALHRRRSQRQHKTDAVPVFDPENAADSTGKGYRRRVHQERGVQVCTRVGRVLYETDRHIVGLL